jgi:hypothetical protein
MNLSKNEINFVLLVYKSPGCKLNGGEAFCQENDQSIALWNNPEALGLIECVGSYKWVPTQKLEEAIVEALFNSPQNPRSPDSLKPDRML